MIHSMTGFGQAGGTACGFHVLIDLKSVNHRYCEIMVRMPREWAALEERFKKSIQSLVKRGRVDVFVTVEREVDASRTVEVNWPLVDGLLKAAEQLSARYSFQDTLSLKDLLSVPEVIRIDENDPEDSSDEMEDLLMKCLQDALNQLIEMRETEGKHLFIDLEERITVLESLYEDMMRTAPRVVEEYRDKLMHRIRDVLADSAAFDETRFAMEVALMADRSNIEEELTRLRSHFRQFRQLLLAADPVGRKLDFLIQEMNREVNTIGSKANHSGLAAKVIEMKAEMEKIREQVQNIE
ncbi:YicC/YloC family endoribonuclease [Ferviditalea candida]|uniref:YicC/YloC family endoribonuclease n=1 Tax=Ferviditalea candida TaxID=3108399 RepID=A0ABU5ZFG0_9BACL|nr:YicC/YloC family endoribonuclease [Paenibacillaceae bacterium T2]